MAYAPLGNISIVCRLGNFGGRTIGFSGVGGLSILICSGSFNNRNGLSSVIDYSGAG